MEKTTTAKKDKTILILKRRVTSLEKRSRVLIAIVLVECFLIIMMCVNMIIALNHFEAMQNDITSLRKEIYKVYDYETKPETKTTTTTKEYEPPVIFNNPEKKEGQ